jgi:predicted nuclease of restriction endonuclease-like RecB superfamily
MLTGDLVRPRLETRGGELQVEMLDVTIHWRKTAAELIALLQRHVGQTQAIWQLALEAYEGNRTDYNVIRGLAKVLSDAATFSTVPTPIAPAELRARVFTHGPAFATSTLLQPETRDVILKEAAAEYGLSHQQAEGLLYADRPAAYTLTDAGPPWTPDTLIARYNLELARAALYWADQMQVHIYSGFKDFWKYIKFFKLMFWATPLDDGYCVTLDGPISPFVKATTRYGRQLAAFLPALFLCDRWQMRASVRPPQSDQALVYQLNHTTRLVTHFKRSGEFDSRLEADFAADFQAKFGKNKSDNQRGEWLLTREDEVILLGDTVMIPDFALTNQQDGRRALVELVGYWHPDYLARKVAKVRAANRRDLILLVYEGVNLSKEKLKDTPSEVLYFANKPVIKEVMEAVERVAM